jgi:hypothetical protein
MGGLWENQLNCRCGDISLPHTCLYTYGVPPRGIQYAPGERHPHILNRFRFFVKSAGKKIEEGTSKSGIENIFGLIIRKNVLKTLIESG